MTTTKKAIYNATPNFKPATVSDNAKVVLEKRYLLKDKSGELAETPDGMFRRVANALAAPDATYGASKAEVAQLAEEFYQAMAALEYVPNSPTLMNAGTGQGTLSACFVLPLEDTMEGIMKAAHDAAMVQKFGGGTGFALSEIRPSGSSISTTHGKACGPINVLRHLSSVSSLVTQGGKRDGANMAVMDVHHPNILDFIDAKVQEGEIHNFNISVGASDEFMQAVKDGTNYNLYFRKNPAERDSPKVKVGELNAREVFDKIVRGAWRNGEPGMIFLDHVNRNSPVLHLGRITATNPCVTADTWAQTADGPRQVRDLIGKPFTARVNGKDYASGPDGFFRTARKRAMQLRTAEGYNLRLTADHLVRKVTQLTRYTLEAEWTAVGDLCPGDRVLLNDHRGNTAWPGEHTYHEGYLIGLLVGDGTLKSDKAVISVWQPTAVGDVPVAAATGAQTIMAEALAAAMTLPHRRDFVGWQQVAGRNESRLALGALKSLAERLGMEPGYKMVTPAVEQASSEFYRGFLRGLFDADGSVQGRQDKGVSIRLAQSDVTRLEAVQRMLLRLGIVSTVYRDRRPASASMLPDGRGGRQAYATRAQHELVISGENLQRFHEVVGFADSDKQERLSEALAKYQRVLNRERFIAHVESVLEDGVEDVYDVQVPGINAFDANGLYAHNCGEQPLLPNESCNLGSIDVGKFVVEKNGEPELDWDRLGRMVRLATHFLENTIDANKYAIPEIEEMNLQTRKVGLGVMGFADMLVELGIPYDSEEGVEMGRRLMRFIMEQSDDESAALAEKRGPYPAFEGSPAQARGERPMRNACRLTVAPTGTISMIAGASSGIEPLFSLAFRKHNILGGQTLYYVDKNLERIAKERDFYSEDLMAFLADGGSLQDRDEVPDDVKRLFHVAGDIEPRDHVLMQAAFQESTDAAISKTINFPNNATIDDVKDSYMLAWETACKGITVYRSGSREVEVLTSGHDSSKDKRPEDLKKGGVLISDAVEAASASEEPAVQEKMDFDDEEEAAPAAPRGIAQYVTPMDRPVDLYGITKRINTGQGKMYVTVNMSPEGRPFEVFATLGKGGRTTAAMAEAVTRLASLSLRSGVDPQEVIKQLRGISSDQPAFDHGEVIFSGPDAIAVAMERILRENGAWPRPRLGSDEHGQPSMFGAPSAKELGLPTATPVERFGMESRVPVAVAAQMSGELCPDCSAPLAHEEGCSKCYSCGFSKC